MLLDVLPLSLGIETAGGLMKTVIRRSTTIPTKQTISNTIDCRNQNMLIKVFEGESRMTKNNNLLGELELSEILSVSSLHMTFTNLSECFTYRNGTFL